VNFYKRYMGDYGRDTAHLSLSEHGAYTLMLDHYYSTEQPLPTDPAALFRICRAFDKSEQRAVIAVADAYFPKGPDGLRHNIRADRQIPADLRAIETARVNGKLGGRPKKETQREQEQEPRNNPVGFDSVTEMEPNTKTHQTPDTKEQDQPLSSSADADDPPAEFGSHDLQTRLATVAAEAIATFNASPLVKAHGGVLASVSAKVGKEKRKCQVRRCLRTARQICDEAYGSPMVTARFWADYWAEVAADPFHSGRQGGGKGHENWVPDFEFLTKEVTMLRVYDRTVSEAAA
jgi:uncharacterized protein YdaU (DUF1376 family)